jgi:hypothetical protein
MAKTNVPFWYGIIDGNTVHLYVLVYATDAVFSNDGSAGSIKRYKVISSGTNQSRQPKHFWFEKGTFDTIRISFNHESQTANKQVVIEITDLDQTSTSTPVLPLPTMDGDLAKDVPYVFTALTPDTTDKFDAEMVVIPEGGRTFTAAPPSGPDGNKNTLSSVTYSSGSMTSYNPIPHQFTVTAVASDPYGGHTFEYKNGKKRKSRTKNNNHTPIPFPRPRRKPKSS